MNEMPETRIGMLYRLALQDEAAGITNDQQIAVKELKNLALKGNQEASRALSLLLKHWHIHPFVREILET